MKVKLDKGAVMPNRAHKTDAGLDLFAREYMTVEPRDSVVIDTGVHVAIPEGYVGFIKSKSGPMVNNDILTDGTIDSGYTGAIKVKLFNHGYSQYHITPGQKIAQLVILPIITPDIELVDSLEETERGSGGFGSTGLYGASV